ncbi:MAG: SDR family NAD(P)-dependent oxidoreductase [Chloroflexi bacterium]|nr:SDR family NAD(P)-dependent oxidoreductase [Chloroflexota bacterium]
MAAHPVIIQDKVVLITGASAGIGRATAHLFAAQGARLVLAARRLPVLQEVEHELSCFGVPLLLVRTDIAREADLGRLVRQAQARFGRIDILVNNAGICRGGIFCEMDPEMLSEMLQSNLHGTFRLAQLVLPGMLGQGSGHIVNVSSISARLYIPGVSVYSATKAAILAFSNSLRREVLGRGIQVTTILGGPVRTGMIAHAVDEVFRYNGWQDSRLLAWLSGAMDGPEAVARAILRAVRYRKRQLNTGGPLAAAMVGLEATAPGLLDYVSSRVDQRLIGRVTGKLGEGT